MCISCSIFFYFILFCSSYFSGASSKGKQSDDENVFSSSGNSYSLFSSPSPWSARQDEGNIKGIV